MQIRNLRTGELRDLGKDWAVEVTDLVGEVGMVILEQPGRVAIMTGEDKEAANYSKAFGVRFCRKLPIPMPKKTDYSSQ